MSASNDQLKMAIRYFLAEEPIRNDEQQDCCLIVEVHAPDRVNEELVQLAAEEAIEDAKENAALNKLTDAEFYAGDVIKICNDSFFEMHGRPDVIITDPPRVGMHEKLVRKILEIGAPVVVYVSCNPATQARDLNLLAERYDVTKIQPVDMFPHTQHIENVVQLKLRK